jgi:putative flippase GtrA
MKTPDVICADANWRSDSAPAVPLHKGFTKDRILRLILQFMRYTLVGGLAFVVDFGLLSAVLYLDGHYLLATLIGFIGGLITNYLLCVFWVWRGTQAKTTRDIVVFSLIGVGGLLLTAFLMWVSVDLLALDPQISKLFIAALVLVWNFGLRRLFVFFR